MKKLRRSFEMFGFTYLGSKKLSPNEIIDLYVNQWCYQCCGCDGENLQFKDLNFKSCITGHGVNCWETQVFFYNDRKNTCFVFHDISGRIWFNVPDGPGFLSFDKSLEFIRSIDSGFTEMLVEETNCFKD